ncbi:hypothetical protein T4C_2960 [Trichinella pseudospiralis]|uniref:Uncharacterized protein n=1 Tax=Trichinella pseudospiralis TaxID=6337 RepID=A0A0V1JN63_TRIPS|nr:hypothetical protein T4C_2960 [Trichinella pseudospiralis]
MSSSNNLKIKQLRCSEIGFLKVPLKRCVGRPSYDGHVNTSNDWPSLSFQQTARRVKREKKKKKKKKKQKMKQKQKQKQKQKNTEGRNETEESVCKRR